MHASAGTLVSDKTAVTTAVAVRNWAAQGLDDQLALVIEEQLSSNKYRLDSNPAQIFAFFPRLQTEKIDRARVSEDLARGFFFDNCQILGNGGFVHLERGE